MTPKQLKKLISETIDEVYKMSADDRAELQRRGYTSKDDAWLRRQVGLQYDYEVEEDIRNLREYQKKLRSTPEGKQLIKAFMTGNGVTMAHGLGYISYAESTLGGKGDANRKSLKKWLDNYSHLNKNGLSTVAWIGGPQDLPSNFSSGKFGNREAITGGTGFLLKGYPVLISKNSVSSQTLSSLPVDLIRHQEHSGIAKRGSVEMPVYSFEDMADPSFRPNWASEVILDNWSVVGCFITMEVMEEAQRNGGIVSLLDDVDSTGLPCYVFSEQGYVDKLE